jgi:hypothetical protein
MMSLKKIIRSFAVMAFVTAAATGSVAISQTIKGPVQIVDATTPIPGGSTTYILKKIWDGVDSDSSPFNGFQGRNNALGKITFIFNGHYDVTAFYIWNDINVRAEGVKEYNLIFYRGNTVVGRRNNFYANYGQLQKQMATFPMMHDVTSVEMEILSTHKVSSTSINRVEIREVAFDGTWFCGGNPTTC